MSFQKATFPSASQVPKLCQAPNAFQNATFSVACQTAFLFSTSKMSQVPKTNDWLKPDCLSSRNQYCLYLHNIIVCRAVKYLFRIMRLLKLSEVPIS